MCQNSRSYLLCFIKLIKSTHQGVKISMYVFHIGFQSCEGTIIALRCNKTFVNEITSGQLAGILVDQTCFYAEQGGQIYDEGFIVKCGDEVSKPEDLFCYSLWIILVCSIIRYLVACMYSVCIHSYTFVLICNSVVLVNYNYN